MKLLKCTYECCILRKEQKKNNRLKRQTQRPDQIISHSSSDTNEKGETSRGMISKEGKKYKIERKGRSGHITNKKRLKNTQNIR
jgi:hypothetical protein